MTDFLHWVKHQISRDKYETFVHLFRFPVKTVSDTNKIYTALEKVFDGQNPVYKADFINPDDLQDWQQYRKEKLKEPGIWRTKGFEVMKTAINSLVIVDLPQQQVTEKPEPYFYFLHIESVVDFETSKDGFEWVIFKPTDTTLAVFDNEWYRTFTTEPRSHEIKDLQSEVRHDLGECPAQWFWSDCISYDDPFLKKSPITNELSRLDTLLFRYVSKDHLDTYAGFPIYWGYEQDCDYQDNETGNYCDGGFLRNSDDHYLIGRDSNGIVKCPVCVKNRITGAGSFVEVPAPDDELKDMREPVGVIPIDAVSLTYNREEINKLAYEIFQNTTGKVGEPINNQAINKDQVLSFWESQKNVLNSIKKQFEKIQTWTTETICKLRYGASFQGISISLGTEWYLHTPEEILEAYGKAKKEGHSDDILDALQDQYNLTEYKNNPEQLKRVQIINSIDPFRHLSKPEVRAMYEKDQIGFEDYYVKVNLSSLIMKFEREQIDLNQFGSMISFDSKINKIKDILYGYASEKRPKVSIAKEHEDVPST